MIISASLVIANWHRIVEGARESPQSFYATLEEALHQRQLPDVKLSRIYMPEGGLLSARREYLRVRRKELVFDLCLFPYGSNSLYISWWLSFKPPILDDFLFAIPFLGPSLVQDRKRETYFESDSCLAFQESIHHSLLEILDGIANRRGLRLLSEVERRPVIHEFFRH